MKSAQGMCPECGQAVSAAGKPKLFCSVSCRQSFNNRRMTRGADLYDLFRALRRNRAQAKELNLWTIICRLEKAWQDEDEASRDGRQSYQSPRKSLANLYDKGSLQRGEVLTRSYLSGRSS